MPLSKLFSQFKKGRRARGKTRSEADTTQVTSGTGLGAPRPTKSNPDFGTAASISTTFIPSTVENQVSSGAGTIFSPNIRLTILPHADNVVSGLTQSVIGKTEHLQPLIDTLDRSAATNRTKPESSLGSAVYASAKVVVDMVKESSDVFPPLKSVAGCLSAVLKHHDVCSTLPLTPIHIIDDYSSKQRPTDKQ